LFYPVGKSGIKRRPRSVRIVSEPAAEPLARARYGNAHAAGRRSERAHFTYERDDLVLQLRREDRRAATVPRSAWGGRATRWIGRRLEALCRPASRRTRRRGRRRHARTIAPSRSAADGGRYFDLLRGVGERLASRTVADDALGAAGWVPGLPLG